MIGERGTLRSLIMARNSHGPSRVPYLSQVQRGGVLIDLSINLTL